MLKKFQTKDVTKMITTKRKKGEKKTKLKKIMVFERNLYTTKSRIY